MPTATATPATVPTRQANAFMVIADSDCEAILDNQSAAYRLQRELRAKGSTVRIMGFASWADAERYEDKMKGY